MVGVEAENMILSMMGMEGLESRVLELITARKA